MLNYFGYIELMLKLRKILKFYTHKATNGNKIYSISFINLFTKILFTARQTIEYRTVMFTIRE